MPGILDHPQAKELLQAAAVTPEEVLGCSQRLHSFLQRYLPLFKRSEQRTNATIVLQGKLSALQRKTSEPIAYSAGVPRKPIQAFVGYGAWDDAAILAELRRHVHHGWGDRHAVLVIDPSSFPKKGDESCGVQRQWCGRLGKVENCQVGVFLFYACRSGHAPLGRQLWLPKEWVADAARREKTHVPEDAVYQERWEVALGMLDRARDIPHGWIAADAEFGRVEEFRARLRDRGERYLLDVLPDTLIRDLDQEVEQPKRRHGDLKKAPWESVEAWAERQPQARWRRFEVRPGEKGPLVVEAITARVQTRKDKRPGPEERLVVTRAGAAEPEFRYRMSNAGEKVPLREMVRAGSERHRAEQVLEEGKGEVGLGHYEVRPWLGWHHHMTLSLLALWFLALERGRVGGGKTLLSVSQLRQVFTKLLQRPGPSVEHIAEEITCVLRRSEESRIYSWFKKTQKYPPDRKEGYKDNKRDTDSANDPYS
jgi:SRSO17 transposase